MIDWFIIRPTEIILAGAVGLKASTIEALRLQLYPELYRPFNSDELSRSLKRDSELHIGQRFGLKEYRDLQSGFSSRHRDPNEIPAPKQDCVADLQQGHSTTTARTHYAISNDKLQGIHEDTIKSFDRASVWWQHITGKQFPSQSYWSRFEHRNGHQESSSWKQPLGARKRYRLLQAQGHLQTRE